jgi:hypothetical protein
VSRERRLMGWEIILRCRLDLGARGGSLDRHVRYNQGWRLQGHVISCTLRYVVEQRHGDPGKRERRESGGSGIYEGGM